MIAAGVDYYPEHWEKSIWESDLSRMKSAGIRVIRIGEFAWSRLEPSEGEYDFEWLDEIINLAGRYDMRVIIGTPTNCPPEWLYVKHPECIQHNSTGERAHTGIRGHRCLSSPVFRNYVKEIVSKLAERYADNNTVYAWQIDNEVEDSHCTCDSCAKGFRDYLKKKYKNIKEVNKTWGTDVWSIDHMDFDHIEPPKTEPEHLEMGWFNPAYILDYERYCSSKAADYVNFQAEIIREFIPNAIITTNSCFCGPVQNFYEEFENLSVAAYDNYPSLSIPEDPSKESYSNAFILDMIRSYKQKNFWILEQLGGNGGCWGNIGRALRPGQLKGYAMQAVAHGGDLISFFRWRSALSGGEMYGHGILDHDNADNRRLAELKEFTSDFCSIKGLEGTTPKSRAAILYSPDQQYVYSTQHQQPGFTYWDEMRRIHDACVNLGIDVDLISDSQIKGQYINNGKEDKLTSYDLKKYSIIFVTNYSVCDFETAEKIKEFVRSGGTVYVSFRSGEKDTNGNFIFGKKLPGVFADMCGVSVSEQDPIGELESSVTFGDGRNYAVTSWCDLIQEDKETETVASYDEFFYAGSPALTRHRYENGIAYYSGTLGSKDFYRRLIRDMCKEKGIDIKCDLPWGVEYNERASEDGSTAVGFLFNNTESDKKATVKGEAFSLKPFEYRVISYKRTQEK